MQISKPADYVLKVAAPGRAIFAITGDGRLFWREREIETDAELKQALLDLRDHFARVDRAWGEDA